MGHIRIIPRDGNVTAEQLYSNKGLCEICVKTVTQLRHHFLLKHAGEEERWNFAKSKGHVIPEDGNVTIGEVYSGPGNCEICKEWQTHLRRHFELQHADGKTRHPGGRQGTFQVKVIPANGDVKIADVYCGAGFCQMSGCEKAINSDLRHHFVNVHVKKTRKCTECQKDVVCASYHGHLESHSGPAKCSSCDTKSDSLQGAKCHIKRRHKNDRTAVAILMNDEEIKDYERAKKDARERSAMRQFGRTRIKEIRTVLMEYDTKLSIIGDSLHERAKNLKNEFNALIDIPSDDELKCNASFASIWNSTGRLPSVVFEIVEKTTVFEIFEASQFFADPKIQHPQPTRTDFKIASQVFHRGHLAAAPNYHEELLVAPTYYYSNVVAMYPDFNVFMRQQLEAHIRELAEDHDEVKVFHFPLIDGAPQYTDGGVAIPSSVATVAIVQKVDGLYLYGWELWNQDAIFDFQQCERNPFSIFQKAGFTFKLDRADFHYISYKLS